MQPKQLIINGRPTDTKIRITETFFQRLYGLIPEKDLPENIGMFLDKCNSIHTFFMRFVIDVVFLDSASRVVQIKKNIKPYRIILPVKNGENVIEFAAGMADRLGIKAGDSLELL